MRTHWSDAQGIARCSKSRDALDAPGSCHRVTTHSVLPRRPPGQQSTKQQSSNTLTFLAVSIAMALQWCDKVGIVRWRRSRAPLEATGRRHRASTCSNNINWPYLPLFYWCFSMVNMLKNGQSKRMAPTNNRGMTYQTEGKQESISIIIMSVSHNITVNRLIAAKFAYLFTMNWNLSGFFSSNGISSFTDNMSLNPGFNVRLPPLLSARTAVMFVNQTVKCFLSLLSWESVFNS